MPEALKKLISSISYLPWIWENRATKLAFFLLNANNNYIESLSESLINIRKNIGRCKTCNWLTDNTKIICNICANIYKNQTKIAIVEEYLDMLTLENSWGFDGVYHILWGAISPINWIFIGDLSFKQLFERIENSDDNIELILATNPNIEWEATNNYIIEEIEKRKLQYKTTITKLSRGLSSGYIEYADNITLMNALKDRKKI